MLSRFFEYIFFIFCFTVSLHAVIYEHDTLQALPYYIKPEDFDTTLIIFDLDNTLVRSAHDFGSDQWFYYQWSKKQSEGYDPYDALCYLLPLYYQIQGHIQLQLTEPYIPHLITYLQKQGIATIALTARGFPIVKRTINQLQSLGISFQSTSFFDHRLKESSYQCAHGIIFCACHQKDYALFDVMKIHNYQPKHIIFVDDKLKYLQMLEKACKEDHISFIGIRYSGCDTWVNAFDHTQAEQDLATFDQQCTIKLYS